MEEGEGVAGGGRVVEGVEEGWVGGWWWWEGGTVPQCGRHEERIHTVWRGGQWECVEVVGWWWVGVGMGGLRALGGCKGGLAPRRQGRAG